MFFVHDKRIFGLICQELDNLVASGALSGEQAAILRRGIAETHIPGTESFQKIANEPYNKDMWVIKPCLSGGGDGIVFGKDIDQETWKALVNSKLDDHHNLSAYQSKAPSITPYHPKIPPPAKIYILGQARQHRGSASDRQLVISRGHVMFKQHFFEARMEVFAIGDN